MHTGLYVVMGVCGSGKSLIGAQLAHALDVAFVEGDALHPPGNVKKMAAGIPLTDDDRHGWLTEIAARLREARTEHRGVVVSCSALKRLYRDRLRTAGDPDVRFIFLAGSRAVIAERMTNRSGHFMPPSLIDSQFAALEPPSPDERAWAFDITRTPDDIVADVVQRATMPSA